MTSNSTTENPNEAMSASTAHCPTANLVRTVSNSAKARIRPASHLGKSSDQTCLHLHSCIHLSIHPFSKPWIRPASHLDEISDQTCPASRQKLGSELPKISGRLHDEVGAELRHRCSQPSVAQAISSRPFFLRTMCVRNQLYAKSVPNACWVPHTIGGK